MILRRKTAACVVCRCVYSLLRKMHHIMIQFGALLYGL